ncbi:MAG TPA: hypothetical protein VN982_03285 [Candidatus Dormibacteraeota bacterium]|nr:hypothetical protein [Candidatus Dormibacteraeota bacterium]
MSTARPEVQHLIDLRRHLEAILSCVKSLHVTLTAVMVEVAAIRKTISEDPDNIDIYNNHLSQTIAAAKPLVDQAMLYYDLQMQEIVDSQQWKN